MNASVVPAPCLLGADFYHFFPGATGQGVPGASGKRPLITTVWRAMGRQRDAPVALQGFRSLHLADD
jgi:hypothetical protein